MGTRLAGILILLAVCLTLSAPAPGTPGNTPEHLAEEGAASSPANTVESDPATAPPGTSGTPGNPGSATDAAAADGPAATQPAPPAAEVKQMAEVGKPAPQFELIDSTEKTHKLSDYKGKIVVVHFQSCRCPWDVAYQPILNRLATQFKNVQFLAINSNRTESLDIVKEYQQGEKIVYPVLKDPDNKVADVYAAQTTPHIYVMLPDEVQTLAYIGGVEKAPLSPRVVGNSTEQYLEPVLKALTEGKPSPYANTQSIGCSIKRVKL